MNADKKIISVILAVMVVCFSVLPACAAVAVEKEEVVYVKLSHDGRVDTIYVVNSFELPQKASITDRGNYSEVYNLSTTDAISYNAGQVMVTAPPGKFYYEGVLQSREIPWDVTVEFLLDGKPISGDMLAGKSGHLQIDFSVAHKQEANPVYLDHYAIQATILLDEALCTNIIAEDATIANVGTDKQLSYLILPGKEGAFTITADVVQFEMEGISINAVPMSLSIDDPDTQELKDKITELQDGAVELDDGATELDDGATKLDDGVLALEDGVAELEDGVQELQDGADDLRDGAHDLYYGTRELKDGVAEIESGTRGLYGGVTTLSGGLLALNSQSETLRIGSSGILDGMQALEQQTALLTPGGLQQIEEHAANLMQGAQNYLDALDGQIAYTEKRIEQARSLGESGTEEVRALQDSLELLKELRAGYIEIYGGVEELTGLATVAAQKIPALQEGVQQLLTQYTVLHSGIQSYTQSVDQIGKMFEALREGIAKLSGGVDELRDGADELRAGSRELYDGTYDLQDGVTELAEGVGELRDGATELRDGTLELKDGTVELVDGTTELREKTADMDREVDDRIDEMLEEYRGKEFEVLSFVDPDNTNVKHVQFVMRTQAISIPDRAIPLSSGNPGRMQITWWRDLMNQIVFL